jgi:predicted MFS family arabinose efflux permease
MTGAAPAGPWLAFSDKQRWSYLTILFLITTSCYIDRGVLTVLLEPIKHEFELSDRMLGLLGGAPFAICYAISSLPLARLADRTSHKNVLIGALIVWSLMTGLCGLAGSAAFLRPLRWFLNTTRRSAVSFPWQC